MAIRTDYLPVDFILNHVRRWKSYDQDRKSLIGLIEVQMQRIGPVAIVRILVAYQGRGSYDGDLSDSRHEFVKSMLDRVDRVNRFEDGIQSIKSYLRNGKARKRKRNMSDDARVPKWKETRDKADEDEKKTFEMMDTVRNQMTDAIAIRQKDPGSQMAQLEAIHALNGLTILANNARELFGITDEDEGGEA